MNSEIIIDGSNPDFLEALEEIIRCETLYPASEGVSKKVLKGGYSGLSGEQSDVFRKYVVDRFMAEPIECLRCGCEIPWRNKSDARKDGYCNGCWEGLNEH
jgi:hypothetical protein